MTVIVKFKCMFILITLYFFYTEWIVELPVTFWKCKYEWVYTEINLVKVTICNQCCCIISAKANFFCKSGVVVALLLCLILARILLCTKIWLCIHAQWAIVVRIYVCININYSFFINVYLLHKSYCRFFSKKNCSKQGPVW